MKAVATRGLSLPRRKILATMILLITAAVALPLGCKCQQTTSAVLQSSMLGSVKRAPIWSIVTLALRTQAVSGKTIFADGSLATILPFVTFSTILTLQQLPRMLLLLLATSSRRRHHRRRNVPWFVVVEWTAVLALNRACARGVARQELVLNLLVTCTRSRLVGARTGALRRTAALSAHS